MLKKLFDLSVLKNQKGSTLSITIIVVAVLAFSITAITNMSVNLSSSTTAVLNNTNDESTAKGLITQAISEFEQYIIDTNSYDDFNNVEIPRIQSELGVIVSDETDNFPDFGDFSGKLTKVYKFAYTLNNGSTIYKYAYMANSGSSLNTYFPYEYLLGTEGDLILNGGYYEDTMIFGKNIYVSNAAPWTEDNLTFLPVSDHITPTSSASFPVFTDNGWQTEIFFGETYQYCTSGCYSVTSDSSAPYVINKNLYQDVQGGSLSDTGDISDEKITAFFNGFSFEDFVVDYASNVLPTNNRTITDTMTLANFETVIRNNMDTRSGNSYPNTPYVDVTNDSRYTPWQSNENVNYGYVYDGDLSIERRHNIQDYDDEGLIVLGDLTIANERSNTANNIQGTYIVTGDLTINGYSNNFRRATFIVFGETYINFIEDYEMITGANRPELSIIGQDNIIIDGTGEDYYTSDPSLFTALLYSEESIFIDTIESKIAFEGGVFAKATGNSANPLNIEDQNGEPIQGIVINSYQGYVSRWYEWDWVLWEWVKDIDYVPSGQDDNHRFYAEAVDYDDYQTEFMNIPSFQGVTMIDGAYTLETSEWKIE